MDCNLTAVADWIADFQKGNPLFSRLGFVDKEMKEYAKFIVYVCSKHESSTVAVLDDESAILGIWMVASSLSQVDDSKLSPIQKKHWRFHQETENVFVQNGKNLQRYDIPLLAGFLPKYRGNELAEEIHIVHGKYALETEGFIGYYAWTTNPKLLSAQQKCINNRQFTPLHAKALVTTNSDIVNKYLIPKYVAAGILPNDHGYISKSFPELNVICFTGRYRTKVRMKNRAPRSKL